MAEPNVYAQTREATPMEMLEYHNGELRRDRDQWRALAERQHVELVDLRAALAGAEQATTDARLTTVWWAHDESDCDEWDANAMFADEQHAKDYALNAWMRSDLTECEDGHVDLATCEECQARKATYRDRLKWLKPSYGTWWELWLTGGEFDGKDMKTGIEVSPTKLHWPDALAVDVPAAADHGHPGGYLSTACLHELHEPECGAAQRARGYVGHPTCKFCGAKCVCRCHIGQEVDRAERVHVDGCTLAADDPHHAGWCALPDSNSSAALAWPPGAYACPRCGTWELRGDMCTRCPECGKPWAIRPAAPSPSVPLSGTDTEAGGEVKA